MPAIALPPISLMRRPLFWAELFALGNVAFLAVDIAMAHAVNAFAEPAEWVPIGFSIAATLALLAAWWLGGILPPKAGLARGLGPRRGGHREGNEAETEDPADLHRVRPFLRPAPPTRHGALRAGLL